MTDPRISLLSNARQSLKTLRSTGLKFRIRVDEAAKLDVSLRGRFTSRGARGKLRNLSRKATVNVTAGQTVTVTVKATAAMRKKLRQEKRLPGLFSVTATDAAGNTATRTKAVSFR